MKTATHKTPTLQQFKSFSKDIAPAARAVLMARVFADMERERVNAYIQPIFDSYKFVYGPYGLEREGQRMTDPKDMYMLADLDDALVKAYYADCDDAHRAHGFRGPQGHCPALHAENLVLAVERELMKLAEPLFGIKETSVYGKDRAKYLELLIGAALKAESDSRIEDTKP